MEILPTCLLAPHPHNKSQTYLKIMSWKPTRLFANSSHLQLPAFSWIVQWSLHVTYYHISHYHILYYNSSHLYIITTQSISKLSRRITNNFLLAFIYSWFNKLTWSHNNLKNFKCLNSQVIPKQEKRATVRTLYRQNLFFKLLSSQIILSNHVMTSIGIFLETLSKKI